MREAKYFQPGAERADRVQALFSRIAPRYDLINDLQSVGLHRLWKRRLVRVAEVPEGGSALDICCGTGDIVRALARAYPRAEAIIGLDFAMPMLRIADERRSAGGRGTARGGQGPERRSESGSSPAHGRPSDPPRDPRIGYLRADALRIPARDASFDRVTVAYGLRNVADLPACLSEVRRVLKPGGRFVALEFGKPRNPIVSRLYFAYLRLVVPVFGRIFFGDPETHAYILDSLKNHPSQAETAEILRAAGFARVRVENPLLGVMGILSADVSGPACGT